MTNQHDLLPPNSKQTRTAPVPEPLVLACLSQCRAPILMNVTAEWKIRCWLYQWLANWARQDFSFDVEYHHQHCRSDFSLPPSGPHVWNLPSLSALKVADGRWNMSSSQVYTEYEVRRLSTMTVRLQQQGVPDWVSSSSVLLHWPTWEHIRIYTVIT